MTQFELLSEKFNIDGHIAKNVKFVDGNEVINYIPNKARKEYNDAVFSYVVFECADNKKYFYPQLITPRKHYLLNDANIWDFIKYLPKLTFEEE